MVPAVNKGKRFSSVNHTTKTVHHLHFHHHHSTRILRRYKNSKPNHYGIFGSQSYASLTWEQNSLLI